MNKQLKDLLFLNRPVAIRIWMWTAVAALAFYLIKFSLFSVPNPTLVDMGFMAYGVGSLAIYVLIYGFDWS